MRRQRSGNVVQEKKVLCFSFKSYHSSVSQMRKRSASEVLIIIVIKKRIFMSCLTHSKVSSAEKVV